MKYNPKIDRLIESIFSESSMLQMEVEVNKGNLNDVDTHGRTPLMVAAAKGMVWAAQALIESGALVSAAGHQKMTALHEAAAHDQPAIADYLLSVGANVDAETIDGVTPLMCAAAWGNINVARILLGSRADRSKMDRTGATAADIASEKGENVFINIINSY